MLRALIVQASSASPTYCTFLFTPTTFPSRVACLAGVTAEALENHAASERESARRAMKRFVAESEAPGAHTVAAHVKKGHPVPILLEEIRTEGADLIVLGRHSGPALAERLLGSVTQTVLPHAECDVLLVP